MTYAIIRGNKVIGDLYENFEDAKLTYLDIMVKYYQDCTLNEDYTGINNFIATKLVKFGNIDIIHIETNDQLSDISKINDEYRRQNKKNEDDQYNEAVKIREDCDKKIRATISNNLKG